MWGYDNVFILVGLMFTFGHGQDVLYPFGPDVGDETLHKNNDGFSAPLTLSMGFPFFNSTFGNVFVSVVTY